jgi:hypothetical protein
MAEGLSSSVKAGGLERLIFAYIIRTWEIVCNA